MNSIVQFPDPLKADDEGLIAVGGELSPEFLISAYAQGIFPWFNDDDQILWWSPNPRMILVPDELRVTKSLRQLVNSNKFEIRIDTCFKEVIETCSKIERKDQEGTWITNKMMGAYTDLHELGIAHSFETYYKEKLVGGLYGVSLGNAFFGESMFFIEPNASKFAFYHLVEWCNKHKFSFIDAQQSTQHMKNLGAKDISRELFMTMLSESLKHKTIQGKWKI